LGNAGIGNSIATEQLELEDGEGVATGIFKADGSR